MPWPPRTCARGRWCWSRRCRTCPGRCTWPWSTRGSGAGGGWWRSRPGGRRWSGRPRRWAGWSGPTPSPTRPTGSARCRGPSTGATCSPRPPPTWPPGSTRPSWGRRSTRPGWSGWSGQRRGSGRAGSAARWWPSTTSATSLSTCAAGTWSGPGWPPATRSRCGSAAAPTRRCWPRRSRRSRLATCCCTRTRSGRWPWPSTGAGPPTASAPAPASRSRWSWCPEAMADGPARAGHRGGPLDWAAAGRRPGRAAGGRAGGGRRRAGAGRAVPRQGGAPGRRPAQPGAGQDRPVGRDRYLRAPGGDGRAAGRRGPGVDEGAQRARHHAAPGRRLPRARPAPAGAEVDHGGVRGHRRRPGGVDRGHAARDPAARLRQGRHRGRGLRALVRAAPPRRRRHRAAFGQPGRAERRQPADPLLRAAGVPDGARVRPAPAVPARGRHGRGAAADHPGPGPRRHLQRRRGRGGAAQPGHPDRRQAAPADPRAARQPGRRAGRAHRRLLPRAGPVPPVRPRRRHLRGPRAARLHPQVELPAGVRGLRRHPPAQAGHRGAGGPPGARRPWPPAPSRRTDRPGGAPMTPPRERCQARARKGDRCRNPAGPDGLCALHRRQLERGTPEPDPLIPGPPTPGAPEPQPVIPGPPYREGSPAAEPEAPVVHTPPDETPRDEPDLGPLEPVLAWAEEALEFLGRRVLGEYEVDEFGHDPDLVEHVLAPLLRPLYRHWWRVETRGLENVPASGPALVVGNHAGTLPFDALMVALALLDEHPAHRSLRMLAADLAFNLPVVAPLARKSGNTLACAEDATRLLEAGELVGVWPEGYKGLGKPYRERYRLQRFGRGGFVEVALRTGSPIVPVAVVGSEEIYPMLANLRRVARLLGFPYFPVTPTFPALGPLGAIPLPSKWLIEFCPPIETAGLGPDAVLDPMVLFDLTDQVRDTIQQTVHRNLLERGGAFG